MLLMIDYPPKYKNLFHQSKRKRIGAKHRLLAN
jgi:hypothetical protein